MGRVRWLMMALVLAVAGCESFTTLPSLSVDDQAAVPSIDWQNSRGHDDGR